MPSGVAPSRRQVDAAVGQEGESRVVGQLPQVAVEVGDVAAVATPLGVLGWLHHRGPGRGPPLERQSTSASESQLTDRATPRKPLPSGGTPTSVAMAARRQMPSTDPAIAKKLTSPSTEALERSNPSEV